MTNTLRFPALVAIGLTVAGSAALMFATPAQAASTPCSPAARACIDLTTQQAWLMHDGAVDYGPVPVRTGRPSLPTPAGTFHVTFKDLHHISTIYHAPMPYSVFFHGGDAFHEGSLAESSHGCVHLTHAAAVEFFDTLQPVDEVQVVR